MKKIKRIGILGGTFNPVHRGHIALAKSAKKEFALDEIIFMPSGNPPHKAESAVIDKEDRFNMAKLAIGTLKNFSISRLEMDRPGYSYAIDTFTELHKRYKDGAKLFYIMGLDSINEILDWKKPLQLFQLCEFIVGTRPGTKIRTFKRLLKFPPLQREVDKIHLMELEEDISSSGIRKKISKKEKIPNLLSAKVLQYIRKKGLYSA